MLGDADSKILPIIFDTDDELHMLEDMVPGITFKEHNRTYMRENGVIVRYNVNNDEEEERIMNLLDSLDRKIEGNTE